MGDEPARDVGAPRAPAPDGSHPGLGRDNDRQRRPRPKAKDELRVLFLAANPVATERLRIDEEIRLIEDRLRGAPLTNRMMLTSAWAVRVEDLARTLRARAPVIVHFSGHGSPDGIIVEDVDGEPLAVPGNALADLFRLEGRRVQCVVLNACYTDEQARAIGECVPFVVGTWPSILDKDAVAFAGRFYESIANGTNLQMAFDAGVNEIALRGGRPDSHHRFVKVGADPTQISLGCIRQRRWLRRLSVAVGGTALAGGIWFFWPADVPPVTNQKSELVIDRSAAMRERFGADGTERMEAVVDTVREIVGPRDADSLALRYGGECGAPSELAVPLQAGAADQIINSLEVVDTHLDFALVDSVIDAIADFDHAEGSSEDWMRRNIVVLTATGDRCNRASDPVTLLSKHWDELSERVELKIDFIGLAISESDADQLARLAAVVEGRSWRVNSTQQVRELLRYLLDVEPMRDSIDSTLDELSSSVQASNEFSSAMSECDVDRAGLAHDAVVHHLAEAEVLFSELTTRDTQNAYEEVRAAVADWTDRLRLSARVQTRILSRQVECDAGDPAWTELVRQQADAVRFSNETLAEVEVLLRELEPPVPRQD